MLNYVCSECGYRDSCNENIKCPACGGKFIKLNFIQLARIELFGNTYKYIEDHVIMHKIDNKHTELRKKYQKIEWAEFQKKEEEWKNKERAEVQAYQNKFLSFIKEAQDQGIPRSRADEIASYAMKHNMYQLPHCPVCGSVDVNKISTGTKVAKTAAFGVIGTMSDAGKTYRCNKCGGKF